MNEQDPRLDCPRNRSTPSDRQTGDVAGIVAVQGDRLEHAYLRRWAPNGGSRFRTHEEVDAWINRVLARSQIREAETG